MKVDVEEGVGIGLGVEGTAGVFLSDGLISMGKGAGMGSRVGVSVATGAGVGVGVGVAVFLMAVGVAIEVLVEEGEIVALVACS